MSPRLSHLPHRPGQPVQRGQHTGGIGRIEGIVLQVHPGQDAALFIHAALHGRKMRIVEAGQDDGDGCLTGWAACARLRSYGDT